MPIFGIYNTESRDYIEEWTASLPAQYGEPSNVLGVGNMIVDTPAYFPPSDNPLSARYGEPSNVFEGRNMIFGAPAHAPLSENPSFSAQNGDSSNVPQSRHKIIKYANSDDTFQDTVSLLDPDEELRADIFSPWALPELSSSQAQDPSDSILALLKGYSERNDRLSSYAKAKYNEANAYLIEYNNVKREKAMLKMQLQHQRLEAQNKIETLLGLINEEKWSLVDLGSFEPEDRKGKNVMEYVLGLQAQCNAATELHKASMQECERLRATISEAQRNKEDAQQELERTDCKPCIISENREEAFAE